MSGSIIVNIVKIIKYKIFIRVPAGTLENIISIKYLGGYILSARVVKEYR